MIEEYCKFHDLALQSTSYIKDCKPFTSWIVNNPTDFYLWGFMIAIVLALIIKEFFISNNEERTQ